MKKAHTLLMQESWWNKMIKKMLKKNNDLNGLFRPKSIALIGASRDPTSVGQGILKSLIDGSFFKTENAKPFKGKVYPINPNADEVLGIKCYKSISDIKEKIDLAIIAIPAKYVPGTLELCGQKKVPFAIIISAGFKEVGHEGQLLEEQILITSKKYDIRLVGPNCLGIVSPCNNMNASFGVATPPCGDIAFISQSGAIADSVIDWAIENRYGFSHIISLGNSADLDVSDFLEYLGQDQGTNAIAIYSEGIRDGQKFMRIAKVVSKKKPIIILKSGKTTSGAKAAASHTGSLAGSYEAYLAAFKQCGVTVANNVEELFDYAKTLAQMPICKNEGIVIVTNAGGVGVLTTDYCETYKVKLAELKNESLFALDMSGKMHPAYSRRNPLDLIGDALPERYEAALFTLLKEDYINGAIVIQTLQTMTNPIEDAKVLIRAKKMFPKKPIISNYMGGHFSKEGIELLEENRIPDFNDPEKAVKCMKALMDRYEWLKDN